MFVIVDYDTNNELGPASYEMRNAWENRGPAKFLKHVICCVNHRIIVRERGEYVDGKTHRSEEKQNQQSAKSEQ